MTEQQAARQLRRSCAGLLQLVLHREDRRTLPLPQTRAWHFTHTAQESGFLSSPPLGGGAGRAASPQAGRAPGGQQMAARPWLPPARAAPGAEPPRGAAQGAPRGLRQQGAPPPRAAPGGRWEGLGARPRAQESSGPQRRGLSRGSARTFYFILFYFNLQLTGSFS